MLGIDEAGRGPVLGSMVYGVCYCPISFAVPLAQLGFADSKQLNAAQRSELFSVIRNNSSIGWFVDIISPSSMSWKMLARQKTSLNAISHSSAMELIQKVLDQGINVQQVFVDTVGDPGKYQAKLKEAFPFIGEITVSKKADSLFPIVSAASIAAKVTRDEELENWKFPEESAGQLEIRGSKKRNRSAIAAPHFSREFGSGYPGDAVTKQWLQNSFHPVFGFPSIVRFSWSTVKKILEEQGESVEWGDVDSDEENGAEDEMIKAIPKIDSFFDRLKQNVQGGNKKQKDESSGSANEAIVRSVQDSRALPQRKRAKWMQQSGLALTTNFA